MKPIILSMSTFILLLFGVAGPVGAQQYTIWHSPLLVDRELTATTISPGPTSTAIRITAPGAGGCDIQIPLILPSNVNLKSMEICYDLSSASSFITQMVIIELTTPSTALSRLQDTTDLTSVTPECYLTTVDPFPNPYSPSGSMTLFIQVTFANSTDTIDIGAIGFNVEPSP